MSDDPPISKSEFDPKWYDVEIPIRGFQFSLHTIREAYNEFQQLASREGERLIALLIKPPDKSHEDWQSEIAKIRKEAFIVTITIIGGKDNVSRYGENSNLFDDRNLPHPIKTVYFTNETSFKPHANGNAPANRFHLWLHFNKPPLIDTNPLVSEPTINHSKIQIKADDLTFLRAGQNITNEKLKEKKIWFRMIHEKFAYDLGLWLFALPYALYMITSKTNAWLPLNSIYESYRIPFFLYFLGISGIGYRALMGYLKWAFPVNILLENKDTASKHRTFFALIILSLIGSFIYTLFGKAVE